MYRMLRISLCTGLLLSALIPRAQEPARLNGAQAVRFQQSPGYFHYVAFCQTAKDFMAQAPPAKLSPDSIEYGFCWYVTGSMSRGNAVSPEAGGRLVISPHHVRFIPDNPKLHDAYADLHPEQVQLKHDPGQPYGMLQSQNVAFRFEFTKMCPACAPGTPAPAGVVPAAADKEFALLDDTIRHFYSAWKQIYRLSSGKPAESQPVPSTAGASAPGKAEIAKGPSPDHPDAPKASEENPGGSDNTPIQGAEATLIHGEPGIRFQQSPGFYHYAALCRTAKGAPAPNLPPNATESAVCWYVKGSKTVGGATGSPDIDGKLVISGHHVRFLPSDPQFAAAYSDLPPGRVALKHQPGQANATLQGDGFAFVFRFSKLCLPCAPGTPVTPGSVPALVDQEFGLLDASIHHFDTAWKEIYRLSSGPHSGERSSDESGTGAPSAAMDSGAIDAAFPPPVVKETSLSLSPRGASSKPSKTSSATEKTKPVRIASGAADGLLVKKVPPAYPLEAKLVRLEGTVVLRAVIEKTGDVNEVFALSGPPLLESAAVDAVKQWQYRPYSQNGQPVDVETTIEVVFALDKSRTGIHAQR